MDGERGSRGQLELTGVPNPSCLVRDRSFEDDSVFRPLPIVWEPCRWVPVGLGCLTALWVRAVAVLVSPCQPKGALYQVCAGTAGAQAWPRKPRGSPGLERNSGLCNPLVLVQSTAFLVEKKKKKRKYVYAPAKCEDWIINVWDSK